eukprot:UN06540
MLHTISYLHSRHIVHQDIKPSNWIFESEEEDAELILIDFGHAALVEDKKQYPKKKEIPDSFPYYRSPEYLDRKNESVNGKILKQSDVWAIGVIAYVILTGGPPFRGDMKNAPSIIKSVLNDKLTFPTDCNLSKSFRDFISKILNKDPTKRLTCDQALEHPWLATKETSKQTACSKKVLRSLKSFHSYVRLKKVLARRLTKAMTEGEPQKVMRGLFQKFNPNNNNQLEVIVGLIKYLGWSNSEAQKIAPQILVSMQDGKKDAKLTFEDFSSIWQTVALSHDAEFLHSVFNTLDMNGDGEISVEELSDVLKAEGIDETGAQEIFDEVDSNKDGFITFQEFRDAFLQTSTSQEGINDDELISDQKKINHLIYQNHRPPRICCQGPRTEKGRRKKRANVE